MKITPKILVVADDPGNDTAWSGFLGAVKKAQVPEGLEVIAKNIWLVPAADGMPFLIELFDHARKERVQVRYMFLSDVLDWIKLPLQ